MKIGIVSDIHEDIVGLEKAFEILDLQNCEEFICLGDISGFSVDEFTYYNTRSANKCLDLIKNRCTVVVPGNHDLYNVKRVPEFISSFIYPENWYEMTYDERETLAENSIWLYEHSDLSPMLNRKNISYLKSLNEFSIYEADGIRILCSHYAYPDLSGSGKHFIQSQNELAGHFEVMEKEKCMLSFSGHKHPEAAVIASSSKFEICDFGTFEIPEDKSWIVVPSIAESDRKLGVAIFDTETYSIQFIELK